MNLENYYWYFEKAIPERICNDIIKYGTEFAKQKKANVGTQLEKPDGEIKKDISKKDLEWSHKKRNSTIAWLNERWIYKHIHPYIRAANINAGWNFDWDWTENCQFTIYINEQHYDWHCDSWSKPYPDDADTNKVGKIRKLSMTLSLSNPDEYDGGNLEFDFRSQKDWDSDKDRAKHLCTEIRPKGSIVIFPSFVWHRVTPVTRGTRHSLVAWSLGKPWR